MPAGAAAVVARRRAQRRAQRLEEQAVAKEAQLETWFASYSPESKDKFNSGELKALLTDVKREALGDPTAQVKEEVLQKILQLYGDEIEREKLLPAVKKYKSLLKHDTYTCQTSHMAHPRCTFPSAHC